MVTVAGYRPAGMDNEGHEAEAFFTSGSYAAGQARVERAECEGPWDIDLTLTARPVVTPPESKRAPTPRPRQRYATHANDSGTAVGGIVTHGSTVVAGGTNPLTIGMMHGGSIVDKRHKYHIGSVRFGTGGLVSLIVIALLLLSGGTAAVIHFVSPSVNLDDVRGQLELP